MGASPKTKNHEEDMHTMSRATRVYHRRFYVSDFTLQKTIEKAPAPDRERYERIDWGKMRSTAMNGQIPTPPALRTQERCRWTLLRDVEAAAKAGDREKLTAMNIGTYNSVVRTIAKYRQLCLLALDRRRAYRADLEAIKDLDVPNEDEMKDVVDHHATLKAIDEQEAA
jgi:hypothetical protein